jgi:hypothetical protein
MSEMESQDFFRDDELVNDPYKYLAALRSKCPVRREPHHDVVMVTGYDEAQAVLGDSTTFSSCMSVTGPFPGFPVPLESDDVSELIEAHRDAIPMSDQIITLDPPTHTDHRPADGTDHAEAPQGERGVHVGAGRPRPGLLPGRRPRRVHRRVRRTVQPARHRRSARRARRGPR